MGFFDLFRGLDINAGVETCRKTEGAVLLDVRSEAEYRSGHIPGSINVPVKNIEAVIKKIPDSDTPVYAYCVSGARSAKAVAVMKKMGYTDVRSIGGITRYTGERETSS